MATDNLIAKLYQTVGQIEILWNIFARWDFEPILGLAPTKNPSEHSRQKQKQGGGKFTVQSSLKLRPASKEKF